MKKKKKNGEGERGNREEKKGKGEVEKGKRVGEFAC
jgi:hypothetical protein